MKFTIKLSGLLLILTIGIILIFTSCNVEDSQNNTENLNSNTTLTEQPTDKEIEKPTEESTTEEITTEDNIETRPVTPCPFDEESLDMPVEIKKEIQAAVLSAAYGEEFEKDGYTLDYAWVVCYGIFDNAYCVMVWEHAGGELSVITEVKVGEYTFMFGSSNTMVVYNNGEFYGLKQAYENEILDDAEIAELYTYYTETHWGK